MTNDTKAEIVIVVVAAAAVLWLWHNNTQATGDNGLSAFPSITPPTAPTAPGATLFDIPAPVAGYDPTINIPGTQLPAFNLQMAAGLPSSCNCAGSPDQAFGSNSDLVSWLDAALDASVLSNEVDNWY